MVQSLAKGKKTTSVETLHDQDTKKMMAKDKSSKEKCDKRTSSYFYPTTNIGKEGGTRQGSDKSMISEVSKGIQSNIKFRSLP